MSLRKPIQIKTKNVEVLNVLFVEYFKWMSEDTYNTLIRVPIVTERFYYATITSAGISYSLTINAGKDSKETIEYVYRNVATISSFPWTTVKGKLLQLGLVADPGLISSYKSVFVDSTMLAIKLDESTKHTASDIMDQLAKERLKNFKVLGLPKKGDTKDEPNVPLPLPRKRRKPDAGQPIREEAPSVKELPKKRKKKGTPDLENPAATAEVRECKPNIKAETSTSTEPSTPRRKRRARNSNSSEGSVSSHDSELTSTGCAPVVSSVGAKGSPTKKLIPVQEPPQLSTKNIEPPKRKHKKKENI